MAGILAEEEDSPGEVDSQGLLEEDSPGEEESPEEEDSQGLLGEDSQGLLGEDSQGRLGEDSLVEDSPGEVGDMRLQQEDIQQEDSLQAQPDTQQAPLDKVQDRPAEDRHPEVDIQGKHPEAEDSQDRPGSPLELHLQRAVWELQTPPPSPECPDGFPPPLCPYT